MARPRTALRIEVGTGARRPLDITPLLPIGDRFDGRDFELADRSGFELRFAQAPA